MRLASLLMLVCLTYGSLSSWATTITPVYGEGADDTTPRAPLPDNPGRTLGAQRRHAHDYVVKLVERVIWLPDDKPVLSQVSWTQKRGFTACSFPTFAAGDLEPDNPDVERRELILLKVRKGTYTGPSPVLGTYVRVEYQAFPDALFSLDPRGTVGIGLHEYVHLLGFAPRNPAALGDPMYGGGTRTLSEFSLHIRLKGDSTPPQSMNAEQVRKLGEPGADAWWEGSAATKAAAMRLLTAGQSDGLIRLDARGDSQHLAHLSLKVKPASIMGPGSAGTLDLGIVAYMLSDIGWGPVVDTMVGASVEDDGTLTPAMATMVTVSAGASSLVVTATLPDGLRSTSQTATPATCADMNAEGELVCTYASLSGAATIQYDLAGTRGLYTVAVDVDHQDYHVDPRPANNFATVEVAIGANTIRAVSLSPSSVAESQPAGTEVGRFGVASAVMGLEHTFALADGGRHNACFRIEQEKLLTAKPFNHALAPRLDLKVLAKASNGFTRERDFTVRVTAASSAATGWTWSTAAHASIGGLAALSARNLALAALLLACAGAGMAGAGKRRRLARRARWAAVALAVLLAASCGGGGGGSNGDAGGGDSPAAPPPAAFTC